MLGTNAPEVEVTNISTNAIWLRAGGRELFSPQEDFPWFKKDVPVKKILNVEEPTSE